MEFITWFADVREKELQLQLHLHPGADHLGTTITQEDQRGDQACLRRIGILKFGRMSSCKIPFAHYPPRLFAVTQTAISTTIKSKEAGWSILCRLPNPQLGILPQKLDTNFKRELSGGERPRRPRSRPELADFRLEPEDCESRVNDPAVIFSMYSHPSGERDAGSSG